MVASGKFDENMYKSFMFIVHTPALKSICKLILFQNAETREGSNGVGLVEVIVTIGIRGIEITWLKIA